MSVGGAGSDQAFGDAYALAAGTRAGSGLVEDGQGDDVLFDDAAEPDPQAYGSNDVFRFAPGSGHDVIADFADGTGGSPGPTHEISPRSRSP